MAWGAAVAIAKDNNKTAGTNLTPTVNPGANAGDVVIVHVCCDNVQTTDGETTTVTSVTDSKGNTYTRAKEFTNGQGAAAAGATSVIFFSKLTTALVVSVDTITVAFAATSAAKGMAASKLTIGAGSLVTVEGSVTNATDGADPGGMTIAGLTSREYLFVHALAGEGPNSDAYTLSANYTQLDRDGTAGGAANSNMHTFGEYRIFTGTIDSVDLVSTTADRDYAQVYVALKEAAGGAPPPTPPNSLMMMNAGI